MASDEGEVGAVPFDCSSAEKAALLDLQTRLQNNVEMKCKAFLVKTLVVLPAEGVKLHSVRALLNNYDLIDFVAPYLAKTLLIRKVSVLQWLFETVAVDKWKVRVGRYGKVWCEWTNLESNKMKKLGLTPILG